MDVFKEHIIKYQKINIASLGLVNLSSRKINPKVFGMRCLTQCAYYESFECLLGCDYAHLLIRLS
jgi:hypothetical protein